MNSKLEELISQNSFIEALAEITVLSQNSFDLSDSKQSQDFERLQELKAIAEQGVTANICDDINNIDNMRSVEYKASMHKVDVSDYTSFMNAAFHVTAQKYTPIREANYDSYIYILHSEMPSDDFLILEKFPTVAALTNYQAGEHFITRFDTLRIVHTIIGKNIEVADNVIAVLSGIKEVIDNIFTKQNSKVGIVVDFEESKELSALHQLQYRFILLVVIYKIIQYSSMDKLPYFNFMFKKEKDLIHFRHILISFQTKGNVPVDKSSIRNEKAKQLADRCLTKNQYYIDLLKSTLSIIDEADITMLILGESGVGKSYLAKIIHEFSDRNKGPFVEINCGLLTQEKLDQRLWGWKKGSFTGALKDHDGIIQRANNGTLFLDEIDNAPSEVRLGLLTFIETKHYEVLGGSKSEFADVRLIFGSNKDLKGLVAKGKFHGDFYARISGRVLKIPPLRNRIGDIDLMINYYLAQLNENKRSTISIDSDAREYLKSYSWPWNIRELEKTLKICFHEVNANNEMLITRKIVESFPFENMMSVKEEDFENLLELLKAFLNNWRDESGSFLEEIIYPLLAKLYCEDCFNHLDKEQKWLRASKILGLSGSQHYGSTLEKQRLKFPEVKDKLGLN